MIKLFLFLIISLFNIAIACNEEKNEENPALAKKNTIIKPVTDLIDHNDDYISANKDKISFFFQRSMFNFTPSLYRWKNVFLEIYNVIEPKIINPVDVNEDFLFTYFLFYDLGNYLNVNFTADIDYKYLDTTGYIKVKMKKHVFKDKAKYLFNLNRYYYSDVKVDLKDILISNNTFYTKFKDYTQDKITILSPRLFVKDLDTELDKMTDEDYWKNTYGSFGIDKFIYLTNKERQDMIQSIKMCFFSVSKIYSAIQYHINFEENLLDMIVQLTPTNSLVKITSVTLNEEEDFFIIQYNLNYSKLDDLTNYFKIVLKDNPIDLNEKNNTISSTITTNPNDQNTPNTPINQELQHKNSVQR